MINKKMMLAVVSSLLILVLSACGGNNGSTGTTPAPTPAPQINVAVTDIADKIFADVQMTKMIEMEPALIKEKYALNIEDYKQVLILSSMMSVKVDELAIVEVKDSNQIDAVKEAMKKRAEEVAKSVEVETNLKDQYEIAQKPVIKSNGNYVFMAISPEAAKLAGIFDSFTQK
jgi:Domain of unknown function (DUF4358)